MRTYWGPALRSKSKPKCVKKEEDPSQSKENRTVPFQGGKNDAISALKKGEAPLIKRLTRQRTKKQ